MEFNKIMIQEILTVIDVSAGKGRAADFYVPFFKKHEDTDEPTYTETEINSVFEYLAGEASGYVAWSGVNPLIPARLTHEGKQLLDDLRNGNTIEDYLFLSK